MPVQFRLEIEEGGEKLTVTDADGNKAFAYGDAEPQPARTDPTESLQRSSFPRRAVPRCGGKRLMWRWPAAPGSCRAVP